MQSDHLDNIQGVSYLDQSITHIKSEAGSFSKRKRKRVSDTKSLSKKEEDRILQYALKLSQKDFKREQELKEANIKLNSYEEIPESATFHAKPEDFQNFIDYVEKCWKTKECSGIMKIVPPSSWVNDTKEFYGKEIFPKINQDQRKLLTRIQKLSELYQAKVIIKLI